jgi:hypothetical protein
VTDERLEHVLQESRAERLRIQREAEGATESESRVMTPSG